VARSSATQAARSIVFGRVNEVVVSMVVRF
jgi:hypothetical protein